MLYNLSFLNNNSDYTIQMTDSAKMSEQNIIHLAR